jgi:hypothetical protein
MTDWAVPKTWAAGEFVTEAHMNSVRDNLLYLKANAGASPIPLPVESWQAPISKLAVAPVSMVQSSDAGTPSPQWYVIGMGTADMGRLSKAIRCPSNYSSAPQLVFDYFVNAANTTDAMVFAAQVCAISATDNPSTRGFHTVNLATITVPDTASVSAHGTISLATNDTMAAGDMFQVSFMRLNATDAGDTAAGTAYVTYAEFAYTG